MERSMAENFAFKVFTETIEKLQSMGYLPRVPTNVVAQVVGASCNEPIATYDQLAERLAELERIDRELGCDDPQRRKHRVMLKEFVDRGLTGAQIEGMIEEKGNQ
jgi:hypothetical protein